MWGDTRFYSSPGRTVYCGQCDRQDCCHHYSNRGKYPWRYFKGWGTLGLSGYNGCCDYESPEETKKIEERHLKMVKVEKEIEVLEDKIKVLKKHKEKI